MYLHKDVTIERAENGYIVRTEDFVQVYPTLDELFRRLLMSYEGRSSNFTGDNFGQVVIFRGNQTQMYQVYPSVSNAD